MKDRIHENYFQEIQKLRTKTIIEYFFLRIYENKN